MHKVIHVTAVLIGLAFAAFIVGLPSGPSLSRFCEDMKAGRGGTAGNLSELVDKDRIEIEKMLSSLSGKPTAAKETCR